MKDIFEATKNVSLGLLPMKIKHRIKNHTFIDLFAGIGGIRIGLEQAGFLNVFSNDFDKNCKITYDTNFKGRNGGGELLLRDIRHISNKDIPQCDILAGGFPCQPFSIAGYRHGFQDEKNRGNLFFDIIRIVKSKKPQVVFLENVKNVKTHDKGNTLRVIYHTLEDLGYHVTDKVINSLDYGNVPQNRERIYILAFKNREHFENFSFPEKQTRTVSVHDCLESQVDSKYYYEGKPLYEKLVEDVVDQNTVYQWRRKYVRENKKGVAPTLTANMGMGGHNVPIIHDGKGIRKLTPQECANLQGFPNDYILPDIADSQLYKQIGNSVSVTVVHEIAKKIKEAIG